ncbi:MAG: PAS domain-containing protein [Candidatus Limnocylindrales bacterium]
MADSGSHDGVVLGGFSDRTLASVFELLARVARAAVATLGPECEVVVHDLRNPEHSVVAISGDLTGRQVGAPVPDPELLPGVVDAKVEDELRRTATTPSGRELVCSTVWIRDAQGHTVGALCINVDVSDLRQARDLIQRHIGIDVPKAPALPTFASSLADFTRTAVGTALAEGAREGRLRKADRFRVIRQLQSRGIFALRGSVDAVAAELGVSRASIYADLKELQGERERSVGPAAPTSPRLAAATPVGTAADGHTPGGDAQW